MHKYTENLVDSFSTEQATEKPRIHVQKEDLNTRIPTKIKFGKSILHFHKITVISIK